MKELCALIKKNNTEVVIFDVDGTLYNLRKLQFYILMDIIKHYIFRPSIWKEIYILKVFREQRAYLASKNISNIKRVQYDWASKSSGVSLERVNNVVEKWIYKRPLKYIYRFRYQGTSDLILKLQNSNIIIVVYSDYPAKEKLFALKLNPNYVFSSTDTIIDRFKPDPKGLLVIARLLEIPLEKCLMIGDRDELDGECARRAGIPYYIVRGDIN